MVNADRAAAASVVVLLSAWLHHLSTKIEVLDERVRWTQLESLSRDECVAQVRREYDDRAARAEAQLAEARAKIKAYEEEAAKP